MCIVEHRWANFECYVVSGILDHLEFGSELNSIWRICMAMKCMYMFVFLCMLLFWYYRGKKYKLQSFTTSHPAYEGNQGRLHVAKKIVQNFMKSLQPRT